jgi:hypothetical protein
MEMFFPLVTAFFELITHVVLELKNNNRQYSIPKKINLLLSPGWGKEEVNSTIFYRDL